jgi:replication-associated recombination protein RarA
MTLVEKYRPKNWDEVFGNDWIKEVLQRMIENDTVQHMMFVGSPGCGNRFG